MIAERARRDHDETTAPEPQSGLQGEGGLGRHQGREDAGRVGAAVRRASQPDRAVAYAAARRRIGHFRRGGEGEAAPVVDVKTLHAKIGELTLENDFLSGALGKAGLLASARR